MPPLSKILFVLGLNMMAFAAGSIVGGALFGLAVVGFAFASTGVSLRFREYMRQPRPVFVRHRIRSQQQS